jgi:hypothetical protein
LLINDEEQSRVNQRLLTSDQLTTIAQRVRATIDKLRLVLDFSLAMINNESSSNADVLMLELSTHRNKSGRSLVLPLSSSNEPVHVARYDSDPIDCSSVEHERTITSNDVEHLEKQFDDMIDRLLSIRSEFIARQFNHELDSTYPCHVQ